MSPEDETAEADVAASSAGAGPRTRARRVRRARTATAIAACVLVIGGLTAAIASSHSNHHHASIAGEGRRDASTTGAPALTVASTIPSTTSLPIGAGATGTPGLGTQPATSISGPRIPAVPAQSTDFTGTIALANTTLTAEQATPLTLTLRNVSNHPVWLVSGLEVFGANGPRGNVGFDGALFPTHTTFAAGEERTLTTSITPRPEMMSASSLSLALHLGGLALDLAAWAKPVLPGVPTVTVSVVPPGHTPGAALDPSQGQWLASVSSEPTAVVTGDPLVLHAALTNTGDQPQQTQGYGALAFDCGGGMIRYGSSGQLIAATTIAPGATQTFSFEFRPTVTGPTTFACTLGITFPTYQRGYLEQIRGLHANWFLIHVLAPGASTTTPPVPSSSP